MRLFTLGDIADSVKSGLDHTVGEADNAATRLAREAWQDTTSIVSAAADTISADTAAAVKGLQCFLQTADAAVSHGIQVMEGQFAAHELSSIVNNMDQLSSAAQNPADSNIKLVPDGNGTWTTANRKLMVEKIDSFGRSDSISTIFAQYDRQQKGNDNEKPESTGLKPADRRPSGSAPDHLDFGLQDIYAGATAADRSYVLPNGERARIRFQNGTLVYEATDKSGRREASRAGDVARLRVGDEQAVLDIKGEVLHFDSAQVKMLQDRQHAQVTLSDGRTIVRANGKLTLLDANQQAIGSVDEKRLTINGVSVFETSGEMYRSDGTPGAKPRLQVSADGESRLILPNGTVIAVRKDHTALIKGPHGEVLVLDQNGRLWQQENGRFVLVTAIHHIGSTKPHKDGSFGFGGLRLRPDGRIVGSDLSIDLKAFLITATTARSSKTVVHLADGGRPTTISGPTGQDTVKPHEITHVDQQGRQATFHLGTPQIDAGPVIAKSDEIRIQHNDNDQDDTVIKSDNTVNFGGDDPAILQPDGSMRLDAQTSIDPNGAIISSRYVRHTRLQGTSHTYGAQALLAFTTKSLSTSALTPAAENAEIVAENTAAEVCAKAANGTLTRSDISMLEGDKSGIAALLSMLTAAGMTDQAANLQSAVGTIDAAIAMALPKLELHAQR